MRNYKAEYQRNRVNSIAAAKAWKKCNPKRTAYNDHKATAKARGIEFLFTLKEWVEWWGDNFANRGCHAGALQMCRYGDTGPYSVGNVYLATKEQNKRDGNRKGVSLSLSEQSEERDRDTPLL